MTTKIFAVLLALPLLFSACKKENKLTNTERLTSAPWKYDVYYTSYQHQSGEGYLQYKKGATNNPLDLDSDYLQFNNDGTYIRLDYLGQTQTGTWTWLNNETQVSTTEGGVTNVSNTLLITEDNYMWNDTIHHTYGEMIH